MHAKASRPEERRPQPCFELGNASSSSLSTPLHAKPALSPVARSARLCSGKEEMSCVVHVTGEMLSSPLRPASQ